MIITCTFFDAHSLLEIIELFLQLGVHIQVKCLNPVNLLQKSLQVCAHLSLSIQSIYKDNNINKWLTIDVIRVQFQVLDVRLVITRKVFE